MVNISKLPLWKDLPPVKGMPYAASVLQHHELNSNSEASHGCAWGLFDNDGQKDDLGTFNLLTPDIVTKAGTEIKTGHSVALNWSLNRVHKPGFGRIALEHEIIDWKNQYGSEMFCFDDVVRINTQAGSQWDGLRHWGHGDTGLYYGGTHHDELLASGRLGIDGWSKRGGIAGRGILLDYVRFKERKRETYDPMSEHRITLREMREMIREEKLEPRAGDLLLVRSGWIKWYEEHSPEEREKYVTNGNAWIGVDGCQEVVEWLWNSRFAAVASDSIGFEAWPAKKPWRLHDNCIAMWGMVS